MAFDVIVFSQSELDDALMRGITRIALCDNSFTLPDTDGIEDTLIGNAEIVSEKNKNEDKPPVYANVDRKTLSYTSSYGGSYSNSYASGSGGSYSYGYKYEYGGSYQTSYTSSFMSSYVSSYQTSFAPSFYSFISGMSFEWLASYGGSYGFAYSFSYGGSYNFGYSFAYGGSFGGSGAALPDIIEYGGSGIIFVNGYGINLI